MSRIDDLIREHCPEGIESDLIGDRFTYEQPTRYLVESTDYVDFGTRVLTAGQTFVLGHTRETDGIYEASAEHPVIIFDDFTTNFKWVDFPFKAKSSAMKMINARSGEAVELRFLYHWMGIHRFIPTDHARQWISVISKQEIPRLPVPVQSEIVRVLDTFTELEAELEAELAARTAQYGETQNRLMDFDSVEGHPVAGLIRELCPEGVPRVRLEQVASYSPSRVECVELSANSFIGVDNLLAGKRGRVDSSHIPMTGRVTAYSVGDILLGNIRPYLKKIWLATNDGGCSGDVLAIRIKEELRQTLEPRFLYYALSSDMFFEYDVQYSKGTKMPRGDKPSIMKYPFLLPPLAIQAEVIRILDAFDSLASDLSFGLPAEIAARRKQYEYYRDKLLSFEGLAA